MLVTGVFFLSFFSPFQLPCKESATSSGYERYRDGAIKEKWIYYYYYYYYYYYCYYF